MKADEAIEKIKKTIDKTTAPEEMTAQNALRVFKEMREDIASRIECMELEGIRDEDD